MKNKSIEFKLLFVFMIAQLVVAWIVQATNPMKGRFLIQETFLSLVAILFLVLALLKYLRTRELKRPTGIQIALLLLALVATAATVNALDPWNSLTGRDPRYEGLYSLFAYYLVCACASKVKEDREKGY